MPIAQSLRSSRRTPSAFIAGALIASSTLIACERNDTPPSVGPVGADGWLAGDVREQLDTVAEHLGGMGDAMLKIGDRYVELHWAGENRNWPLAAHQIAELDETMQRALMRRPQYANASEMFLNAALPAISEAVEGQDLELFRQRFAELTVNCNACHMVSEYPFVRVMAPRERTKPWHWPSE